MAKPQQAGMKAPLPQSASDRLHRLCRTHGITIGYEDERDGFRSVPDETLHRVLSSLGLFPDAAPVQRTLPSVPEVAHDVSCYLPDWLQQDRSWGLTCQVYELRSARNWGIGDFADLRELARIAAAAGADLLGVNPLHALFIAAPSRCSPFSPSNRRFLNPLYIAVDEVPGAPHPPAEELSRPRAAKIVDYEAVARLKIGALRTAFDHVRFGARPYDQAAHDAFLAAGGTALQRHALFESLSMVMAAEGHGAGWTGWPQALRDPRGEATARFAGEHTADIEFHAWLQWIASVQLASVRAAARAAGMRIGLYLDLAVGEAHDGSATWSDPELTLEGVGLGAPPDVFATEGQNWNLAAPHPRALAERGFAPFRDMIAAQMRYAGALRIDHAMALWQLFLVPEGRSALAGAHLRYPFAEMVEVLAEQSQAQQTMVIGEDLGFVPEGFREAMAAANILSYRILYFEKDGPAFLGPEHYPSLALACLSTHDLPTLASWWRAEDVSLRGAHGLVDEDTSLEHFDTRAKERTALLAALGEAGVLPVSSDPDAPALPAEVLAAAHRFIARTPCLLAGVRLADLVGPVAPTNLPGTVDSYPNWRLRCPVAIEDLAAHPAFLAVTEAMAAERPRRDVAGRNALGPR